mgnify:CR=1 FL=1
MNVGIVGLGLIGGSFAKAYHKAGHTVLAAELDRSTLDFAMLSGAADTELTPEKLSSCDLVLICVYPAAAVAYMRENAAYFGERPVVMDCCGTKRDVVPQGAALANEYGFTYVGAHPMAGRQYSGFKYSTDTLYHNAPMVIVPQDHNDIELLGRIKELLAPAGFGRISVTTAEAHDEMIAFTSQLAHVVSSAYIKSPTARRHRGFSAGSYKDMTRVAWLNPGMWSELFIDNRDNLIRELDILIENLIDYRTALEQPDRRRLYDLLDEGRRLKEEVDGR